MITIQQLKLKPGHSHKELEQKILKQLRIRPEQLAGWEIIRQSLDARKNPELFFSSTVEVKVKDAALEKKILDRTKDRNITKTTRKEYCFPQPGEIPMEKRPVIIGTGPCGLFCGYLLARHGYRPILLERGESVENRCRDVENFWQTGQLNIQSNVQFGEGGAGTFSDGKLNTLVKDKDGRGREVLRIFVENGAPKSILYDHKPHIGTDILCKVVRNMREKIIEWGGEVHFQSQVVDFAIQNDSICGVILADKSKIEANDVVLAIGHSARDTFQRLFELKVPMEAKSFAVGLRVEHPQELINLSQYGTKEAGSLGAAPYKLTAKTSGGRGVYSFCMCPGGYVVNASSEEGRTAVNGMSYSGRNSANANSAVIVSVTPEDFPDQGPLGGIAFQRSLEEAAYRLGNGRIPVQYLKDFSGKEGRKSHITAPFSPCMKGEFCFADVASLLPQPLKEAFLEGMEHFDTLIPGFADDFVLLSGVESRTSSPVRIHRDESMQSAIHGLYPCGEGAGYAGGITSAAMDGIKAAEKIACTYQPFENTVTG